MIKIIDIQERLTHFAASDTGRDFQSIVVIAMLDDDAVNNEYYFAKESDEDDAEEEHMDALFYGYLPDNLFPEGTTTLCHRDMNAIWDYIEKNFD